MSEFFFILGNEKDDIMEYCLGKNWRSAKIQGSHILFNKSLNLNLKGNDNLIDSARLIKNAYCIIKRNSKIEEIIGNI